MVGVIVKVENQTLRVLTQRGAVMSVAPKDVGRKLSSRDAVALDVDHREVRIDDVVNVINGPNKGRRGIVRHIYRAAVFLQDKKQLENAGIVAAMARSCSLAGTGGLSDALNRMGATRSGAMGGANAFVPASPSVHQAAFGGGRGAGRGRGRGEFGGGGDGGDHGGGRGRGRGRDPKVGQTVVIVRGEWKGKFGRVKDVVDNTYRVELQAVNRIVPVDKSICSHRPQGPQVPGAAAAAGSWPAPGSQTPFIGLATPRVEHGAQTPRYAPRTPLVGTATPAVHRDEESMGDSQFTPTTPFNAETPHWRPETPRVMHGAGSMDVDEPSYTPATPAAHTPVTPSRPAHTPVSTTPAWDAQTPAPHTPATPLPPQTPAEAFGGAQQRGPVGATVPPSSFVRGAAVNIVGADGQQSGSGMVEEKIPQEALKAPGVPAVRVRLSAERVVSIPCTQLRTVPPSTNDSVVVLQGEYQGQTGSLIGVDGEDGIVKIQADIFIVNMSHLGLLSNLFPKGAA
jgi:transcription elongation factor SPT5